MKKFRNTAPALNIFSAIFVGVTCGISGTDLGLVPELVSFVGLFIVSVLLLELAYFIIYKLQKLIFRFNIMPIIYFIPEAVVLSTAVNLGFYETEPMYICIICGCICAMVLCAAVSSWYALIRKRAGCLILYLVIILTTSLSVLIGQMILSDGQADGYIASYLELAKDSKSEVNSEESAYEDETMRYKVGVLDYNDGDKLYSDLISINPEKHESYLCSTTFDLTRFVSGYEKMNKWYRDLCLGYTLESVPLRARVYYPVDAQGKCPIMFLMHGNHTFVTQSYLGYDYLGEYLAGNGYIVVSVDANSCNGNSFSRVRSENDARALLLLEHIDWFERACRDSDFPLSGRVDFNNIILAGHSRGGEAAAIAALFNDYDYYPDNGRVMLDFDYNIKAVVAIAPTVDQYMPSGHTVELEDINYLLIQGANDQDLAEFIGMERYNTVVFTGEEDCLKASLYIAGANHGQFNDLWGKYDLSMPRGLMLNTANLIDEDVQQTILKYYVRAFLDSVLFDDASARALMYDAEPIMGETGTIYIQNYMTSDFEYICSFEEDSDLSTATDESFSLSAVGESYWAEAMMYYSETGDSQKRENYALRLSYNNDAEYRILSEGGYSIEQPYFQLDICDVSDRDVLSEKYDIINAAVRLEDGQGRSALVNMSDYSIIYPPLPVRLGKLQYLQSDISLQHQLGTVRLPVSAFIDANPELDLENIKEITICFFGSGEVWIDNIGFGS